MRSASLVTSNKHSNFTPYLLFICNGNMWSPQCSTATAAQLSHTFIVLYSMHYVHVL